MLLGRTTFKRWQRKREKRDKEEELRENRKKNLYIYLTGAKLRQKKRAWGANIGFSAEGKNTIFAGEGRGGGGDGIWSSDQRKTPSYLFIFQGNCNMKKINLKATLPPQTPLNRPTRTYFFFINLLRWTTRPVNRLPATISLLILSHI